MASETTATTPRDTSVLLTTPRGLATASFCLGMWGSLTFWWYPFGMWVGMIALLLGTLANVLSWRVTSHGEGLAKIGMALGSLAIGGAYTSYRVMQMFFEKSSPTWP
jgi:hypothetical protein